jgi:hypothetical protein
VAWPDLEAQADAESPQVRCVGERWSGLDGRLVESALLGEKPCGTAGEVRRLRTDPGVVTKAEMPVDRVVDPDDVFEIVRIAIVGNAI